MNSRWNVAYDKKKDGAAGYLTSREPQKDFVALMRASLQAARTVDPSIRICGFSTADWRGDEQGTIPGPEWTAGVLEHDGLQWCDLLDYHHYSSTLNGFPGDDVEGAWQRQLGPILDRYGSAPKPVWMSEGQGSMETHRRGLYRTMLPGEDGEDVVATADRVVRHELALLATGAKKIFLYSPFAQGLDVKNRYSTLVAGDNSLHPSAAAHSTLAWHLEDAEFTKRAEVAKGIYAYLFRAPGRSVAVLSSDPQSGEYAIPHHDDIVSVDLFGNPLPAGSKFSGTLVYLSTKKEPEFIENLLSISRGGTKISPVSEVVVHRLLRPRYWGVNAPESPFGAHFNSRRQLKSVLGQWRDETGDPLLDPARLERWNEAAARWKTSVPRLNRGPYPDVARVSRGELDLFE